MLLYIQTIRNLQQFNYNSKMMERSALKKLNHFQQNQSDQSSSLQFLGSDKQQNDGNQGIDEQLQQLKINSGSSKRKKQSNNEINERIVNGAKKRQKSIQQQSNNTVTTFLYKPQVQLPNLLSFTNLCIKVVIAAEYITKDNPAVIKHKIYGTDTYSANSDCVCIGLHYGLFNLNNFLNKKYEGVQIIFKVIKPKKNYTGSSKNNIHSQTQKNYNGSALKPESCKMLPSLGTPQNLQKYAANMHIVIGKNRVRAKPENINKIVPIPWTNLIFNMNNQPAFKYSIYNIADKGFDKNEFLVKKLDSKVLYFETSAQEKYQLSKYIERTYFEAFKFTKLKNPQIFDNQFFMLKSLPLETEYIQVLENLVQWDQIIFGTNFIKIKDVVVYNVTSFKYYNKKPK